MGANIDRRITESIVIKFNGCVCSLKEFQQQTLHMYIIFTLFFILRKLASACQSAAKDSILKSINWVIRIYSLCWSISRPLNSQLISSKCNLDE